MLAKGERREVECGGCGQAFTNISMHWKQSDCQRPMLTDRQQQFAVGLVMGDGHIELSRDETVGFLQVTGTNTAFLEWLSDEFGVLSCGVRPTQSGEQIAENMKKSGLYDPKPGSEFKDIYQLTLRTHPVFAKMRAEWYGDDGIRYPNGLKLTPLAAKMWYCSDGGLSWSSSQHPHVVFGTYNESERPEFLYRLFERHGFSPTYSEPLVRFTTAETPGVLDWMGDAPPGFEYKWRHHDRREYDRLKSGVFEQ